MTTIMAVMIAVSDRAIIEAAFWHFTYFFDLLIMRDNTDFNCTEKEASLVMMHTLCGPTES